MFLINLIKCLCCALGAGMKADAASTRAENSLCCLPCKGVLAVKDCYDHCTAEVGVEDNNGVQMAGAAPADVAMA